MSTISLDKFAEQIIALRDAANNADPGSASRIGVYGMSGLGGTPLDPDTTHPGLNNLQGVHLHQTDEVDYQHGSAEAATWPQCVILQ